MTKLDKETFQKLFLLYFLDQMHSGVYGEYRLQKLLFHFERKSKERPFEIKHYRYGAYSETVAKLKDLLLQSHWIKGQDVGATVSYVPNLSNEMRATIGKVVESIPGLAVGVSSFLRRYGKMSNSSLEKEMYDSEEFKATPFGNAIFTETLPNDIDVNIDEDVAEDIKVGTNFSFLMELEDRVQYAKQAPFRDWRSALSSV